MFGLFKVVILVVICWMMVRGDARRGLQSFDSAACKTCINNANEKWCTLSDWAVTWGVWCGSSDVLGFWASSSLYICTDSPRIEGNGAAILCPYDEAECGSQLELVSTPNVNLTKSHSSIGTNNICHYDFTAFGSLSKLNITLSKFSVLLRLFF